MMKRSTMSLLGGCASIIALAVTGALSPAQAQTGFQGVGTGVLGAPIINTDDNSVAVTNSQTVIDWTPSDTSGTGAIDFLPQGQTASFSNAMSGGGSYTVLNRILPVDGNGLPVSRIIGLNGTVQSGAEGSIWFYSPGGIVAGSNSVFDVGSLVLTSNAIDTTDGLYGANGEIRFRGVTGNGAVEIRPGAQINALAPDSYVALVAPRVVQSGTVTVNGTAAYVGAEQVDFQINAGLFSINILAGTTDGNGVVHDGTTARLPSSDPSAVAQRVYMVAVPKNNALTMLLSGNVSYAAADSVISDNGAVILAAGHDISDASIGARNATATGVSDISFGAGIWQRGVTATATGNISVQPGAGTVTQFDGDLVLTGRNVRLQAGPQSAITIGGNMLLSAATGAVGGQIDLLTFGGSGDPATNGRIGVTGDMTLYANGDGFSGSSSQPAIGADATGGIINIIAAGGDISAAALTADASAIGGYGSDRSGDATGGGITLTASTANGPSGAERGSLNFDSMSLDASAGGFSQFSTQPVTGGNARGGTISIRAAGGSLSASSLSADASANGSEGADRSGDAIGGSISLSATTATGLSGPARGSLNVSNMWLDASAQGDRPYYTQPINGGSASGGAISIGAAGGSFSASQMNLDVSASGGEASGVAGTGTGGNITLFASAADGQRGSFALTDCGLYYCNAYAGGQGASGAEGAAGTGGTVLLYASDGDFSAPGVLGFSADGVGGLGGSYGTPGRGADGRGGSVTVEARQGATLSLGELRLTAAGSSGTNVEGPSLNAGNAGNGVGGTINLSVLGGALTVDRLDLDASAFGGGAEVNCPDCSGGGTTPFQAGAGRGGVAQFLISGGSATLGALTLNASGTGGEAAGADISFDPQAVGALAGTGRGGTASLTSSGGVLQMGNLTLDASGRGGEGLSAFQGSGADGGAGVGGTASLLMTAGSAGQLNVDGIVTVQAIGMGGNGGQVGSFGAAADSAGRGGDGTGGITDVTLAGGALTAPALLVAAGGTGGLGGDHGSDGIGGAAGNGMGGKARLSYRNEGHAIGDLTVSADGRGGEAGNSRRLLDYDSNGVPIYSYGAGGGGSGGVGTGGAADLLIDVDPAFSSLTVSADGVGSMGGSGGTGGAGGTGMGGTATLNMLFGATTVSGAVRVSASGQGGLGGSGYTGAGGRGGDAFGGAATFGLAGASTTLDAATIMVLAEALGGDGGAGGLNGGAGVDGADGGQATGGAALMTVTTNARATSTEGLRISGNATGGAGSGGSGGITGGNGGAGGGAQAGSARLRIDGGHFTSGGTSPQPASHAITAIGQGGSGAAGSDGSDSGLNGGLSGGLGGSAGHGVGGLAAFEAIDGDYALGSLNLVADGFAGLAGAGGNGPGGGSAAGLTGVGSGGTASLSNGGAAAVTGSGLRSLGLLTMSASGDVGGRVQLADHSTGANGGLRITGAATLFSRGAATTGFSGIHASGSGNRVRMGSAQLVSDGPLSFAFSGGAGWTIDGVLAGSAASGIGIDHVDRTAGSDSLFAGSMVFDTPGNISLTSAASLGTVDRLTLLSQSGSIDLASGTMLAAGGDARLFAQGGLNGAGATVSAAGSVAIGLGGNGDIRLGTLASGGPLDQSNNAGLALGVGGIATGGTIQIGTATTGGGMSLTGQGVDVQNLTSGGATLLNAGTGDLRVGNILSAGAIDALGRNIALGSTGTMTIADAAASGSMTVNAATLNAVNLSAGATLTASTTGLATLSGLITAPTITLSSGDIAIGSNAQIGNASGSVTFNAVNLQRSATVGGNDVAGAYSLSAAELARVTANAITVHAASQPVAGAPDIIVRDLTMGSANLAPGGVLTLSAAGRLRVEGAVQLTDRSGMGGLTLAAGEAVEVIAGSGSVAIGDANGGLGGVLTLSSPRVFAATLAAIADVSAASSLAARELRLAQNDGVTIDAGMLRAGSIVADVTDGLYIQNVGLSTDFADRRGFTANDFSIATGGRRAAIVINGQLILPTGAVATGRDVLPLVGVGGYAVGSKINGCLIGTSGACLTPVFDSRDTWEATVDPAVTVGRLFTFSLIELRDIVAQGYPPLIDEPVTGAGNEDLWERRCGGPDEAACGD